jgi:hypothetical protein
MQNVVLQDSLGHQTGRRLDHGSPPAYSCGNLDAVASVN